MQFKTQVVKTTFFRGILNMDAVLRTCNDMESGGWKLYTHFTTVQGLIFKKIYHTLVFSKD